MKVLKYNFNMNLKINLDAKDYLILLSISAFAIKVDSALYVILKVVI